jgi:hypothetical protein
MVASTPPTALSMCGVGGGTHQIVIIADDFRAMCD